MIFPLLCLWAAGYGFYTIFDNFISPIGHPIVTGAADRLDLATDEVRATMELRPTDPEGLFSKFHVVTLGKQEPLLEETKIPELQAILFNTYELTAAENESVRSMVNALLKFETHFAAMLDAGPLAPHVEEERQYLANSLVLFLDTIPPIRRGGQ